MQNDYGDEFRREKRIQLTKDEQKEVVKQAIQEWLDGQFARFGRYSLVAVVSALMAAVFYLYLAAHGFKGM
jgi:hypothetical protein